MQEETPLPPAQIITSLILLPQNFLHWALDRRGRAACCSLSGVLLAGGTDGASGRRLTVCGRDRGLPRDPALAPRGPRPSRSRRAWTQSSSPSLGPYQICGTRFLSGAAPGSGDLGSSSWLKQSPPCPVRAQRGACQPPCGRWRGRVSIPGKGGRPSDWGHRRGPATLGSDEGAASRCCPFLAASVLLKDQPGQPRPGQEDNRAEPAAGDGEMRLDSQDPEPDLDL